VGHASDLDVLLSVNTVTGAAALFRRELLDVVLPLPPRVVQSYHDHWIALCALATGDIAYIDEPLYDYVQHGAQVLGHGAGSWLSRPRAFTEDGMRSRLTDNWRPRWEADYFELGLPRRFLATAVATRCHGMLDEEKTMILRRAAKGDSGVKGLALTATRAAKEIRRPNLTTGHDVAALRGALWRRAAALSARRGLPHADGLGAVHHNSELQDLGRAAPLNSAPTALERKLAPLRLRIDPDAPRRVNLLMPHLDLEPFSGRCTATLNLAAALARAGRTVRVVGVDAGHVTPDWRERLRSYQGVHDLDERVELVDAGARQPLTVSSGDDVVATTWRTALLARAAAEEIGRRGFLYLIQEFEPSTFPRRTHAALAESTYDYDHAALFSTEVLQRWFADQRLGVFAAGRPGAEMAACFRNAITRVRPPSSETLAARKPRRILFYAGAEPNAARNMFELGELALRALAAEGTLDGWEIYGIGSVGDTVELELGAGRLLELLPRIDQSRYADLLPQFDVGVALMDTPHPGLAPIEMASAGMVTVTTTFGPKDEATLHASSPNLRAVEPTPAALTAVLRHAIAQDVEAVEDRVRGADVDWPTRWEQAFDDPLVSRILSLLERVG
jgi:hypothetical protein